MKSLFPILLCLLLLLLTACQPDFSGSRMGTLRGLHMSYTAFHTTEKQTLSLKAGEDCALPGQPGGDPVHHHLEGGGGTHL